MRLENHEQETLCKQFYLTTFKIGVTALYFPFFSLQHIKMLSIYKLPRLTFYRYLYFAFRLCKT